LACEVDTKPDILWVFKFHRDHTNTTINTKNKYLYHIGFVNSVKKTKIQKKFQNNHAKNQ